MTKGRGGLGPIYVWAAGNGRAQGDNCNYDGWANSRYALTIGAVDATGQQPWYSENCAAMHAVAPSSGAQSGGIYTTDLLGNPGTSNKDCTERFGGTVTRVALFDFVDSFDFILFHPTHVIHSVDNHRHRPHDHTIDLQTRTNAVGGGAGGRGHCRADTRGEPAARLARRARYCRHNGDANHDQRLQLGEERRWYGSWRRTTTSLNRFDIASHTSLALASATGLYYSHKFGFGLINAAAAVEAARTWTNYAGFQTEDSGVLKVDAKLVSGKRLFTSWTAKSTARLLYVELTIDVKVSQRCLFVCVCLLCAQFSF
jgi:hypothetical protein